MYSVVVPVNVTDLDSSTSEAGSSVLIMTPNVDIEKATEVEMPAIVDKENDEFAVVHANPEWSNVTPTQNTPVSDCSPVRLPDPLCC